jgi:SAM-dependent methyltransferase
MINSTARFSDRVADYVKYRPDYPPALVDVLKNNAGLPAGGIIADIGSGTGKSSLPFLKNGHTVYAVEPNGPMREAAEAILHDYPNFISVEGTAEDTGLISGSVDLVFSGQAFHWFDREKSRREFERILKPGGIICLVWNVRNDTEGFGRAYEQLLSENLEEYGQVNHKNIGADEIAGFFRPRPLHTATLPNQQWLDLDGLKGRLKSSSYCPRSGPLHEKLMNALEALFREHSRDNRVAFEHETQVYWG